MINKWSDSLDWWMVKMTQDICGHEFFNHLGYKIFNNKTEYDTQRRTISIDNRRIVYDDWIFRIKK